MSSKPLEPMTVDGEVYLLTEESLVVPIPAGSL